jgi:hypothetical protein
VLAVDVHLPDSLFLVGVVAARLLHLRPPPSPNPTTKEERSGRVGFPLSIPAESEVVAASPD